MAHKSRHHFDESEAQPVKSDSILPCLELGCSLCVGGGQVLACPEVVLIVVVDVGFHALVVLVVHRCASSVAFPAFPSDLAYPAYPAYPAFLASPFQASAYSVVVPSYRPSVGTTASAFASSVSLTATFEAVLARKD